MQCGRAVAREEQEAPGRVQWMDVLSSTHSGPREGGS
jgi:hypothetical protein